MHTNTRHTRSPPKPLGQLYAQESGPLIASHTDNASRAPERSVPSGLVNREDPDRLTTNPGIGGGPCNEKLLLSFQIVQEKAGWHGANSPLVWLSTRPSANGRPERGTAGLPPWSHQGVAWPTTLLSHKHHSDSAPRSLEQTQATKPRQARPAIAMALAVP